MKSIIFGSSPVGFWDSIYISVVSMLIVFFVLIFISYILSLLKYLPQEQEKREERIEKITDLNHLPQKKISAEDIKDEKILAAVSVALIEAAGDNPDSYIKLISVRELN